MQGEEKSLISEFFHKKSVRIVLLVDVLIIIFIASILVLNAQKTSVITFDIAPLDAKILVNGSKYENGKTYKIAPGNYKIEISHDGLNSKELNVNLENDHALTVSTFLTDGSGEFYELKENYSSFEKLSEIASARDNKTIDQDTSLEKFIASFKKKISISDILPIIDFQYGGLDETSKELIIDQDTDCEDFICLIATGDASFKKETVDALIKEKGYNSEDYEIKYELR